MNEFAKLLGKSRTPLLGLFSKEADGWIDMVSDEDYPKLDDIIQYYKDNTDPEFHKIGEVGFDFPQSLDDFGFIDYFRELYSDKYCDYIAQWNKNDNEIIEQQLQIQEMYLREFPRETNNYLYFMVSKNGGIDRVVYIGTTKRNLLLRYFNGPNIMPKINDWIGDCRSYESPKKPNYTWRVKSAELRRRGVYKIVWYVLPSLILKAIETEIINQKRLLIEKSADIYEILDPVNLK